MYHFIGIKGSGMSSLAQIMHNLGYPVQGSDVANHYFTEIGLKEKGITFFTYNKDNITSDLEIIVGNSIKEDHEELIKAKELNLTIHSYQEMVGNLTKETPTIGVSGCHGKTTTTAMLAHVLGNSVGCNYLIGDGTGEANKNNKLFALESCEYQRHFLSYFPKYVIITNIELDHVDYFKDINDVIDAYTEFANKGEVVIAWGDDPYTRCLMLNSKPLFYGISDNNDVVAKNIEYNNLGSSFDVYINNEYYNHFNVPFCGEHIVLNSLAVITICYLEKIDSDKTSKLLSTFIGAKRRFTETFVNNCVIIDDYAHHPTEINATINSARQKYPDKQLVAVFQPHTFTRTKEFINEYVEVLAKADKSFVLDLHPSREKQEDYPDVTSYNIIDKLDTCDNIKMDEAEKLLPYKDSVILFMGANDLGKIENDFENLIKE